jgi:transcriptional regulator with XRE-family HTH domain
MEYKVITRRLRLVRQIKGWTLHEVEKHSNGEINAIALGSWERGDRKPTLERLLVLCNEVYKVPLAAVVSSSDDEFIKQTLTTIYADPSYLLPKER